MFPRYVSRINRVAVESMSPREFLGATFRHYSMAFARNGIMAHSHWRSPSVVRREYDAERKPQLDRMGTLTWDEMLYGLATHSDFVLLDDRISWAPHREPLEKHVAMLATEVDRFVRPGETVVEFCSGNGRNLLHLKRHRPDVRCVGLELSPTSLAVARQLAAKFGLEVEFHLCDVTSEIPPAAAPDGAALVFSYHGLEQMPRIFPRAVERMLAMSRRRVLMLEPVPELWPSDVRGVVSRLRVRALDRLRGLMSAFDDPEHMHGWHLETALRVGTAVNPLNETCEIALIRLS